jgi:hypothetical protein
VRRSRRSPFELNVGEYAGHTVELAIWHGLLHETASGDIAPGFGPLEITKIEIVEHREQDDDSHGSPA